VQSQVRQERERLRSLIESLRSQEKLNVWKSHIQSRVAGSLNASDLPGHWPKLAEGLEVADSAELVIRAEILAETASPADEQSKRMEIQVQRLADGMGGNGNDQSRLAQMESLVACWCLLPEDESLNQERADRLIAALEAAVRQPA
jgi:DNA repair protein SbcC/Rad50